MKLKHTVNRGNFGHIKNEVLVWYYHLYWKLNTWINHCGYSEHIWTLLCIWLYCKSAWSTGISRSTYSFQRRISPEQTNSKNEKCFRLCSFKIPFVLKSKTFSVLPLHDNWFNSASLENLHFAKWFQQKW